MGFLVEDVGGCRDWVNAGLSMQPKQFRCLRDWEGLDRMENNAVEQEPSLTSSLLLEKWFNEGIQSRSYPVLASNYRSSVYPVTINVFSASRISACDGSESIGDRREARVLKIEGRSACCQMRARYLVKSGDVSETNGACIHFIVTREILAPN
jgi:hypothetical protein